MTKTTRTMIFAILFQLIILYTGVVKCQPPEWVSNHPLTIIQPEQQQQIRLLQLLKPHEYRIYGHFPSNINTNIDIGLLRNIFAIASNYFNKIIQVTPISQPLTRYPFSSTSCGISVPEDFIRNGFDQSFIDLVIFIVIQNNVQQTYVAAAAPCIKIRRPVYGFVIFNSAHVETNLKNTGSYHSNIYVTMHELTHILGLNSNFYTEFYESPLSTNKLRIHEVIGSSPYDSRRTMIITQNVKNYVQKFFNCTDKKIGALLQDQGSKGSAGSHWERKVYFDQMMTASTFTSGLKISQLTLNLLKDTGFFFSVRTDISQKLQWGKNKGCQFALGLTQPKPEFSCSTVCDFYNVYGGQCSNKDQFANNAYYLRPYNNVVCTLPGNSKYSSSSSFVFDAKSRCFDAVTSFFGVQPHCYLSKCSNKGIEITIENNVYLCNQTAKIIQIPGGQLICPQSQTIFCSVKSCDNWCNSHGICVAGQCYCALPFKGVSCLVGCPSLFDYELNQCVQSCPNKVIFNNGCIGRCPPAYKVYEKNICEPCRPFDIFCYEQKITISIFVLILILILF